MKQNMMNTIQNKKATIITSKHDPLQIVLEGNNDMKHALQREQNAQPKQELMIIQDTYDQLSSKTTKNGNSVETMSTPLSLNVRKIFNTEIQKNLNINPYILRIGPKLGFEKPIEALGDSFNPLHYKDEEKPLTHLMLSSNGVRDINNISFEKKQLMTAKNSNLSYEEGLLFDDSYELDNYNDKSVSEKDSYR